jgi:hypothetical protein
MGALNAPLAAGARWASCRTDGAEQVFDFMPVHAGVQRHRAAGDVSTAALERAGLPIGMQFVGRFGDEATLLQLAGQLERARPWAQRKPTLEA